jgi:hypothetical protein
MLHTFPMIFEALFIALPFLIGLGVTGQRGWRAFGTWVVLETLLYWLATIALKQGTLAGGVTTLLLGTTGFGGGLLLARKRRTQVAAAPGLAFLCGVLVTGAIGGALASPVRHEVVKTAKWVNTDQETAWKSVISLGADSEMVWKLEEGKPSAHLLLDSDQSQMSRDLLTLESGDVWLTQQDEKTHVLRVTNYTSRLVPAWLWSPIERRLVGTEDRESLAGLGGRFVAAEEEGVPVVISVQTNPPTLVTVDPPSGSVRPRLVLGQSPIRQRSGAHVGDTVLMQNEAEGINSWEIIQYGQPGEHKVITRVFTKKKTE